MLSLAAHRTLQANLLVIFSFVCCFPHGFFLRVKSPWYFFNRKNNSEGKKHRISLHHTFLFKRSFCKQASKGKELVFVCCFPHGFFLRVKSPWYFFNRKNKSFAQGEINHDFHTLDDHACMLLRSKGLISQVIVLTGFYGILCTIYNFKKKLYTI